MLWTALCVKVIAGEGEVGILSWVLAVEFPIMIAFTA